MPLRRGTRRQSLRSSPHRPLHKSCGHPFHKRPRFAPSGFIHVGCAREYLETAEIFGRLKHFSPALTDGDLAEIREQLG